MQVVFVETQGDRLRRLSSELAVSRPEWHVLLVVDATAGLELLSQRKIGLVLANFDTDKAGCEAFFRSVKDMAPQAIRMGLLPDHHQNTLAHSLDYAHQCIATHCDCEKIEALITRGLSVRERIQTNPKLAEFLSNLQTLPTPPTLYFDIKDELESPKGSARSVAQVITRDPAITAKLLKVANSGFYGSPGTVSDLYEAITLLGSDLVLALVLSAHLYDRLPLPGLNLDALWKHGTAVATLAKMIATEEGASRATASTAAIAGLLHDIGGLIFLANRPEDYFSLVRCCGGNEQLLQRMELEQFGVGHPELGALILSLWGLPEDVVVAVADHHAENLQRMADLPVPSRAVCAAEYLLTADNLEDEPTSQGLCQLGHMSSEPDAMAVWQKLLSRLVEQGLIPESRTRIDAPKV